MRQAIKIGITVALLMGIGFSSHAEDLNTKLLIAVYKGDIAAIRDLLVKGAAVNVGDKDDKTALMWAADFKKGSSLSSLDDIFKPATDCLERITDYFSKPAGVPRL